MHIIPDIFKHSSLNIVGKKDLEGNTLFSSSGALDPGYISEKLGTIIYKKYPESNLS